MKTNCKNNVTEEELRAKGYTYSAAARALKCSVTHVYLVVNKQRSSARLVERLRKLPQRAFRMRERAAR